jgi:imidazolonepropionase-like amidohydrolase
MKRRLALLLASPLVLQACGGSTPPPAQPAATKTSSTAAKQKSSVVHYTVFSGDHVAGSSTVSVSPNEMKVSFAFNDRGRGPDLDVSVGLAPDGAMKRIAIKGVNYFKMPVAETASISAGKATWKCAADHGDKALDAPALYVPFDGPPPIDGLLANTLLHAPEQKMALLPGGQASIKKIADKEVTSGSGEKKTVTLYQVTGFWFTPFPIWLDAEGLLFMRGEEFFSVIRSGFESERPGLFSAQTAAEGELMASMAKDLAHKPGGALAITHAKLFDPDKKALVPNTTVLVDGPKVSWVGPDKKAKVPKGAEVIDAKGRVLLPGLFDMHQHLGEIDGPLDILHGVTTSRDLANDTDKLLALKKRWHEGTSIGPRVLLAGFIDGPGPYAGPTKVLVSSEEEAKAAVDHYAQLGYLQIKIYSSVDPKLVPVIVREAKAKKLRVSGHVPATMRAEDAVKAGFDEIQHINFLMLNFMPDVQETRTPARFTEPAERGARLDLKSKDVKAFIDLLKKKKIVVDPTLNVFEDMFTSRTGTMAAYLAPVAGHLPVQVARSGLGGGLPVPEGKDQVYKDSFTAMKKMVKALHDAGVTIVAGTDALAGVSYDRELELYAEAGIPTKDVLALATIGSAKVMHFEKELGSVSKGKRADMVLIDGNPLAKMSDIRKVNLVVKNGLVFKPEEMDRALGIQP